MKTRYILLLKNSLLLLLLLTSSCSEFVEVDVPNDRITSATVFNDDATARRAMDGVYGQLFNTYFAGGGDRSVTFLAGLSADTFSLSSTTGDMIQFAEHELDASNGFNLNLWAGAYNTIYMCNAILEGVGGATNLSDEMLKSLEGESRFIRAFTYFYLTQLYGDVPLITQTAYAANALAARVPSGEILMQVLEDLDIAASLLSTDYPENDRTQANASVVKAFLARVHLYMGNWEAVVAYSNAVIAEDNYALLANLDGVFLAHSEEALWQISPEGWGSNLTHTREGNLFVRINAYNSPVRLSPSLMSHWEEGDRRRSQWVGTYTTETETYYYPYKYKIQYDASGAGYPEYSMVLRLAEQYLIRAEAYAQLGDTGQALYNLNVIRERAGLNPYGEAALSWSKNTLMDAVFKERRSELFSEWGHRWFDLKRSRRVNDVYGGSATWEATDRLYPIPEDERLKNPNLTQNEGY
ncbi:MAG: RagB/SusD family nutrient uptake outer membrane protein [Cytophagaceae bacterium]|nr:RagB/SusD family nutrient uptake outer membrane protein [Cytophagaceae bacterium]